MMKAAIILARGGSIGLPKKNILTFCGKPLISWTIQHCLKSGIEDVYVSSDCNKILEISSEYGAIGIKRPIELSGPEATSESAWFHALKYLEKNNLFPELIIAPQVTSPIRHDNDIRKGLDEFVNNGYDSLFSASLAEDLFLWHQKQGVIEGINHNWNNRQRRQDFPCQLIENGSFYIFKSDLLRTHGNRLGGKIGFNLMEKWKMFEIDDIEDFELCEILMKKYILEKICE